jgi:hypothetical protein
MSMANKSISVSRCHGQGPNGGRVSTGARGSDAAHSLVKSGVFSVVDKYSSTQSDGGYTITIMDTVYKLNASY